MPHDAEKPPCPGAGPGGRRVRVRVAILPSVPRCMRPALRKGPGSPGPESIRCAIRWPRAQELGGRTRRAAPCGHPPPRRGGRKPVRPEQSRIATLTRPNGNSICGSTNNMLIQFTFGLTGATLNESGIQGRRPPSQTTLCPRRATYRQYPIHILPSTRRLHHSASADCKILVHVRDWPAPATMP